MREIKFRAWNNKANYYVTSPTGIATVISNHLREYRSVPTGFGFRDPNTEPKDGDYCIEQFTGLNDSNGICIYDGDILTGGDHTVFSVVQWNPNKACWSVRVGEHFPESLTKKSIEKYKSVVVGNIHETLELLNK